MHSNSEKQNSDTSVTETDNNYLLSDKKGVETKDVTPRDLLRFAKIILLFIAVLFILASITEVIWPKNAIFETCKIILPSIATLVIGYYFGSSTNN